MPTIAAIHGEALGGGLELALACDLRIAAADARLGFPAARLGLVYSHTGIARAMRILGSARAKQLFLVGEPVDAQTALAWGAVQRVVAGVDLLGEARSLARRVAGQSRVAQRGNRRILHLTEAGGGDLTVTARDEAERLRAQAFETADLQESIHAFQERRERAWTRESR